MNTGRIFWIPSGLLLAVVWALLAISIWALAVVTRQPFTSISLPTFLLAGVGLVSANLALQRLASSGAGAFTPRAGDQRTCGPNELEKTFVPWLTWCLGCVAAFHWLGFLATEVESIIARIVLVLLVITFEMWLAAKFLLHRLDWHSHWIGHFLQHVNRSQFYRDGAVDNVQASVSLKETLVAPSDSIVPDDGQPAFQSDDVIAPGYGSELRATSLGIDPDGRAFHAGWVKLTLTAGQKSDMVTISFCPAIVGETEIELECEPIDFEAAVVQQTPSGMRIEIRRSQATESVDGKLQWQCTEKSVKKKCESLLVHGPGSPNSHRVMLP